MFLKFYFLLDDSCAVGRFLCANENCIPEEDMCNGVDDCDDNSDETTICSGNNNEIYILTYSIYI